MTDSRDFGPDLARLEEVDLLRTLRAIDGPQDPWITVDGQRVLGMCSNNYLGLANDPRLVAAARATLDSEGLGAGASRLVSGSMAAHRKAESVLASFVIQPESVLFSSGYAANVGTLQALASHDDLIISDTLNHASLIDGCRLSRATTHVYTHCDPDHVRALLSEHRHKHARAFIVTDALFSMDGDRARLHNYASSPIGLTRSCSSTKRTRSAYLDLRVADFVPNKTSSPT